MRTNDESRIHLGHLGLPHTLLQGPRAGAASTNGKRRRNAGCAETTLVQVSVPERMAW